MLLPTASGKKVKSDGGAEIDYSNTGDGYVMARVSSKSGSRLKVQVLVPTPPIPMTCPPGNG